MEQGWDPDVKDFFVKILNSISITLIWMIATATAGLYFQLAYTTGKPLFYTILFYTAALTTLFLLIRHLYKVWKNG